MEKLLNTFYTDFKSITDQIHLEDGTLDSVVVNVKRLNDIAKIKSIISKIYKKVSIDFEKYEKIINNQVATANEKMLQIKKEFKSDEESPVEKKESFLKNVKLSQKKNMKFPPGILQKQTWSQIASTECLLSPVQFIEPKKIGSRSKSTIKAELAPGVFINAFPISKLDDCRKYKGEICYWIQRKLFCVNIGKHIFHGKVGDILDRRDSPLYFREFDPLYGNPERTTYYMCPAKYPNSTHIRTWTNRMSYVPASVELRRRDDYALRIGSRSRLASDLREVTDEDFRLAKDYFMSLFLVMYAMACSDRS